MTVRGATLDATLPLDWAARPAGSAGLPQPSLAAAHGTKKRMRTDSTKGAVEYTDGELRCVGKQIKKRWNDFF